MNEIIKVKPNKDGKYIVKLFGYTIELVVEQPNVAEPKRKNTKN